MADYDHEAGARAMFLALHDAFKEMGFVPVSSHFGGMLFKAALAEIERQQRAARKELTLADLQEPAAPDDLRMLSAYRTVPSITTDGTAAPVAEDVAGMKALDSGERQCCETPNINSDGEPECCGCPKILLSAQAAHEIAAALTRLDEQLRVAAAFANANGHERVKAEARAERAEADAKALREAWRGLSCPSPFATNRTKTAGECMDREQCGCENRAALAGGKP